MKRFLISAVVSMACFMAHAQSITIPEVNLAPGGEKSVEVAIPNATNFTAFQFDLALPTGITVKSVDIKGQPNTREIESGTVNGKYRVLSYDTKNTALTADATLSLTLQAANDVATGEKDAEVESVVIVTPGGDSTIPQGENDFAINVSSSVKINITSDLEKTTYVSDFDLDFTDNEAKAYIVTGIEGNSLWMTRVYRVPAGTPVVVKGSKGEHEINTAVVNDIYYKSLMIGNNTDNSISVTPEAGNQYYFFGASNGFTPFTSAKNIDAHKAYICAKELPAATVGSDVSVTISKKTTSLCSNVDLDFTGRTDDVKAYIATGYDGNVWLTPVEKASAGTPLYIKGSAGTYTIPSVAAQTVYANMLKGNNSDAQITISPTDGEYTNYFVSTNGFNSFTADRNIGAHKSYLQVLSSYIPAASRGFSDGIYIGDTEAETLKISWGSLGGDDDETTSIHSIDSQLTNDTWYNLNGQRIDTPKKKGLYIKNGRKVVVR